MSLKIYFSSASGSREVKQQQNEIFQYLTAKKVKYEAVDICQTNDLKEEMRRLSGNPKAMPPQVFFDNVYCGDYNKFFESVEDDKADAFFKLK
ncbi:SH3 domain-binding glutamic acid-rich-like protein 3 [Brienomyrus brachyistius]|uniref:SH3 domain-binding glutamic acid-rich-like protein 3 n=1 Tax=Brienomyrus brachyistius TaxID=42636 RepID=UPI0020B27C0F|nr:SH3 domain-binding glutamic acid-rich-like protein 3 [Brienomyrus brachyistius]